MIDQTLDVLLEAVRFLLMTTPLDRIQWEDRPTLDQLEQKIDALIAQRKGRE